MEGKMDEAGREDFMISVEEFDAPDGGAEGAHEFSAEYEQKKEKMLKAYRKKVYQPVWGRWVKAAAAFLLVFLTPVIVSAASGSEFFGRLWGTSGKENIESHEEVLYDEEKETSCIVTYPQREYTDEGLDKAEELLGGGVSYQPIVKEIGDTRLTVSGAAYDGDAAVVEFTLEREGGVKGVLYGQLYNESKGAWFAEDAPFRLVFRDCSENIFVDLDKSTEDLLYCYAYLVTDLPDQAAELQVEIYRKQEESGDKVQTDSLFIPILGEAKKEEYVNADGGRVRLSPMSMDVDCNIGLGLSKEEAYDPWHIYYVAINYKDGSIYVVHEHGVEGLHSCEVEIDNTSYACGTEDSHMVFVFNRLVDTGNVESVVINETVYTLK